MTDTTINTIKIHFKTLFTPLFTHAFDPNFGDLLVECFLSLWCPWSGPSFGFFGVSLVLCLTSDFIICWWRQWPQFTDKWVFECHCNEWVIHCNAMLCCHMRPQIPLLYEYSMHSLFAFNVCIEYTKPSITTNFVQILQFRYWFNWIFIIFLLLT